MISERRPISYFISSPAAIAEHKRLDKIDLMDLEHRFSCSVLHLVTLIPTNSLTTRHHDSSTPNTGEISFDGLSVAVVGRPKLAMLSKHKPCREEHLLRINLGLSVYNLLGKQVCGWYIRMFGRRRGCESKVHVLHVDK